MIDPKEAPKGYRARREVVVGDCVGCEFLSAAGCSKLSTTQFTSCVAHNRNDGHNVIFVKIKKMRPKMSWDRDEVQFPRLLSELVAAGAPNKTQMKLLCESMDLEPDDINELLDRAHDRWEAIKLKGKK